MHVELRAFQREILEAARAQNVVMVGETGIGKTFLAIALLAEQDYSGGRRAFFMAPTRQLVVQITAKIRQTSTLRVNAYCGRSAELWNASQWQRELELNRVFVCTPEVVRNVLQKGYVLLEHMNLLVFDECHHVTKRHPYAQIVKMYNDADPTTMPRIFGTTACPTKLCAEKLRATLMKVSLDVTQLKEFAAAAPIVYETYPPQAPWSSSSGTALDGDGWVFDEMMAELQECKVVEVFEKLVKKGKSSAANDTDKLEKAKKKFIQSCLTIFKNLGPWCYYRFAELEIHRLAISATMLIVIPGSMYGLDTDACKTMLMLSGKRAACDFACTTKVKKAEELVRARLFPENLVALSEDDADEAAGVVESENDENENDEVDSENSTSSDEAESPESPASPTSDNRPLQGILFVDTRAECRVLTDYLNEKFEAEQSDEPDSEVQNETLDKAHLFACILGRASRNDAASFHLPKMERTLSDFESGAVRLLVSTSVSVEGVDFPQCGLIVVMDKVKTARTLIQLRGRARHEDGVVYYLGLQDDLSEHVHLKQLLQESEVINRLEFSKEKVETLAQQPRSVSAMAVGLTNNQLRVESTGAVLDLDSAIPCINMFCQALPPRLFTVDVKKMYQYSEIRYASQPLFVASLSLPEELELPKFESEPMTSKAGAKSIAAFKACRHLVENGLLDGSFNSVYRSGKTKASANAQDLSYFFSRLHT